MAPLRELPALVRKVFKAAQDAGDLTFYATQVSILSCDGLFFQLRFSPTLANKPKSNKAGNARPVDPFETPQKGLFISDLEPSHYLVLNKFPVIPGHFILATKAFKQQTDLLEQDDLEAAYKCLKAYKENGEELFGFFNSGEHSGASQAHRHIQFLPVDSMRGGVEEGTTWSLLADSLTKSKRVPFTYFSSPLPEVISPRQLHNLYIKMYEKACRISEQYQAMSNGISPLQTNTTRKEESLISYNLAFTDKVMVLCPRVSEGPKIQALGGDFIGPIALNGTILGGTLLVKTEEEWQALRNDQTKLNEILSAIGIPSTQGR